MFHKYGDGNLPKDADGRIRHLAIDFMDTWRAMEKLVEKGLAKSLAVCNFTTAQLRRLMKEATIKPSLLQVESNPRIHNEILR